MSRIKVYTVGGGVHDSCFIYDHENTENMEEADLVLFTGGADIHPDRYGEPKNSLTYPNITRDDREFKEFNRALNLNKFMFGICRGLQLGTVASGGRLIQHIHHPGSHNLKLWDGTRVHVNSLHHQLPYPYNMDEKDYLILGFAEGLSKVHWDGENNNMELPLDNINNVIEPEIIYFQNTNFLGVQFHPEMMSQTSVAVILCNALIRRALFEEDSFSNKALFKMSGPERITAQMMINRTKKEYLHEPII